MDHFISEFALGPAIDRPSGLNRGLTGRGQYLSYLFGGERTGGTATRGVTENVFDSPTQCGFTLTTFDGYQRVEGLLPPPSPEADLLSCQAEFDGDLDIELSEPVNAIRITPTRWTSRVDTVVERPIRSRMLFCFSVHVILASLPDIAFLLLKTAK